MNDSNSKTQYQAELFSNRLKKKYKELFDKHQTVIKEQAEQVKSAGGLFILGTLAAYLTSTIAPVLKVQDIVLTPVTFFSGTCGLLCTWLAYHLLAKKNWSIMQCVLLFMVLSVILGVIGVFGGSPFLS